MLTNGNGDASFTFSATGVSQGKSITATATSSDDNSTSEFSRAVVAQPNHPPTVANDSYSVDEDTTLTVSASDGVFKNDTDPDHDSFTAALEAGPSHGTLSLNTDGSSSYTPSANYNGSDSFTYKANDGEADSSAATVSITVNPVNDAPTDIALDNQSVPENQPSGTTVGSFSSTDVDSGDTHSYSLVSGEGDTNNASFDISGSTLKTKESFDYETKNSYSIRVRTTDSGSPVQFFEKTFTISVTNVEAPNTILDSGPSSYTTNPLATFTFHSNPSGATFECSLDNAAYQSCSSPKSYTKLLQGSHTFKVRAKSAAGVDATPATQTFVVDRTMPDTQVTGGPQGQTNNTKLTFTFSGTDNPVSNDLQFSYNLDSGAWSSYSSDTSATLGGSAGLTQGSHTFYVRVKDPAGNVDTRPASRAFIVDTTAPTVQTVSPANGATGISPTTNVTATFSEVMASNSLNATTVTLVKEGDTNPVSATVTYSRKTVTLDPASSLQSGAKYTATIKGSSGEVKDAAGNLLAQDKVWSFTVK